MIEIEEIIKKIEKGENKHNDLTYFIYSNKLTNHQLIRILFKTLTHSTLKFKNNEYDSKKIYNIVQAIFNLLNNANVPLSSALLFTVLFILSPLFSFTNTNVIFSVIFVIFSHNDTFYKF